jgi:hypothetical protein
MTAHGYRALRHLTGEARTLVEAALATGWRLEPAGSRLVILAHHDGRRLKLRLEGKDALSKLRREVRA